MKPWKRIEPTVHTKVGHRLVITKLFEFNGKVHDFQTYETEGQEFAAVIAITKDNKAIVTEQFRAGPEKIMYEPAGGFVDEGESPETAASRELTEETGYKAGSMKYLGKVYKDAYSNGVWHYFLATDCEETGDGQFLEETEQATLKLISIKELIDNAKNARMTDMEGVMLALDDLKDLAQH